MVKTNMFDDVLGKKNNNQLPKKQNPHTKIENLKTQPKYKSARIRPEDFEFFREYAHKKRITIVEAISLARDLLEKNELK